MKIEKLFLNDINVETIISKINELIDTFNESEINRSEQILRFMDKIDVLNSRFTNKEHPAELLPCPFCGTSVIDPPIIRGLQKENNLPNHYIVYCSTCAAAPNHYVSTELEAIKIWNTRV